MKFVQFMINPNWGSARSNKPAPRAHPLPSRQEAARKKRLKLRPMVERVEGVRLQLCESDRFMAHPVTSDPVQVSCDRPAVIRSGQGAFFCADCGGGWNKDSIEDAGGLFDMASGQPIAPKVAPPPAAVAAFNQAQALIEAGRPLEALKLLDIVVDEAYAGKLAAKDVTDVGWMPLGWRRDDTHASKAYYPRGVIWRHHSGASVIALDVGFDLMTPRGRDWKPYPTLATACVAALGRHGLVMEQHNGVWLALLGKNCIAKSLGQEKCAREALVAFEYSLTLGWSPLGWTDLSAGRWQHPSGAMVYRLGEEFGFTTPAEQTWRPQASLALACCAALEITFLDASGIGACWHAYLGEQCIAYGLEQEMCARAAVNRYDHIYQTQSGQKAMSTSTPVVIV